MFSQELATFGDMAVYVSQQAQRQPEAGQRNHLEISRKKSANGALRDKNAFFLYNHISCEVSVVFTTPDLFGLNS